MKQKDVALLKNKPVEELQKQVATEREHLQSLRFDLAAGKAKNIGVIRETRRTIARLLTFIKEIEKKGKIK